MRVHLKVAKIRLCVYVDYKLQNVIFLQLHTNMSVCKFHQKKQPFWLLFLMGMTRLIYLLEFGNANE